jgi:mono/diheme cytochrome c family protein
MDSNDLAMHTSKALLRDSIKWIHPLAVPIVVTAVIVIAFPANAQSPTPSSKTKAETTTPVKAEPLSGVELWTINCSRCHTARNPGEFTAAQWRTIIRHMRVRANLPAAQVRELQKYLEGGAGK